MAELFDTRRYLTDFDSARTSNLLTDILVVGSGVGGTRAALEAAQYGEVILLTKQDFEQSATSYAQGGIAAALGPEDSPQRHLDDTVRVGCGLNRRRAVEILVREGPERIGELQAWGADLDRVNGSLDLAREGGHSLKRVVHMRGDQTGRGVMAVLRERLARLANVRVFENCFLIDFVTRNGTCVGAVTYHPRHGHQLIWARQTILASGGCGRIWRETTNPPTATGDGVAAAYRAGCTLADMEMMQFHPTTLYVAGSARALISEAVRGEGAHLLDRGGRRFMQDHHPDMELAPRDIVSRAIHRHLVATRTSHVLLDVRHIPNFAERFPQITRLCADFQIDVRKDLIPVRPSAHYMVGGVRVQLDGGTDVAGLWCCGEAARTGVHGANRMASNSLLEGLVFGRIAGQAAGERARAAARETPVGRVVSANPPSPRTELDVQDVRNSLRSLMWRNVGIERSGDRLVETGEILKFWGHYTLDKTFDDVGGWELQNELTVARAITMSALERDDSVGVHYRADGRPAEPSTDPHAPEQSRYTVCVCRYDTGTRIWREALPKE
ncbi:MAG TPA: L-aspartate oxidase [Phycisphaerae bacterium]|nr:L-aspartate oxidase [Phycisphaerae bacterium]HNU45176.1 L-aspartate oxidase [Phycisphaerae bacterium]